MKVLVVEHDKAPYVKDIPSGLEALQSEVGGYIQVVYPFDDNVGLVCNEEGKLMGLPLNRPLYHDGKLYDILAGTFLVVGLTESDFDSLTDEQIEIYTHWFRDTFTYAKINGEIVAIPN